MLSDGFIVYLGSIVTNNFRRSGFMKTETVPYCLAGTSTVYGRDGSALACSIEGLQSRARTVLQLRIH